MVLKSLCLNMIVKNESKILLRCLESVVKYLTYYVICDTGSTDGTQKMIKAFFDQHKIPGEILEIPWVNFGYNRNKALERAKGKADYILLIDADMTLKVIDENLPDFREDLDADFYQVDQDNGGFVYSNVRLLRGDVDFDYVGVTHEYVNCKKPNHVCKKLPNVVMPDKCDGFNRPDKYARDIKLLREGLDDKKISLSLKQRYTFYLAQSHRDNGNMDKALKYYKERSELGGWAEEVYYALYMCGTIHLTKENEVEGVRTLLKCYQFRPHRIEPLHTLIKYYRIKEQYEIAKLYLPKAMKTKYPKDDLLFIDKNVYSCLVQLEAVLISRHTGDVDFGRTIAEGLIHLNGIPNEIAQEALNQMIHYVKPLGEYCPSFKKHQYTINKNDPKFNILNPSIIYVDGEYIINTREVNYKFHIQTNKYEYLGTIDTYNKLGSFEVASSLDPIDFTHLETTLMLCKDEDVVTYPHHITGYEDLRLVIYFGKIYAVCTCIKTSPLGINEICLLHLDGGNIVKVVRLHCDKIPAEQTQKNWAPFVHEGKFKILYSNTPTVIMDVDIQTGDCVIDSCIGNSINMISYRGSSQVVKVGDQYVYVVHSVAFANNRRYYFHRFVRMGEDLKIKRISPLFRLADSPTIEFCAGLAYNGKDLVLTWGVEDCEAWIGTVNTEEVLGLNL